MYFYIISCQANILSAVSITNHIDCVNLIIFRGDFEDVIGRVIAVNVRRQSGRFLSQVFRSSLYSLVESDL